MLLCPVRLGCNSSCRISNGSAEKENSLRWATERRSGKRPSKAKLEEVVGTKRKIIGVSDYPKPYKQRETQRSDCHGYLSERRRDYSIERWSGRLFFLLLRTLVSVRIIPVWQTTPTLTNFPTTH